MDADLPHAAGGRSTPSAFSRVGGKQPYCGCRAHFLRRHTLIITSYIQGRFLLHVRVSSSGQQELGGLDASNHPSGHVPPCKRHGHCAARPDLVRYDYERARQCYLCILTRMCL